jgi:hypothetical protein
MTLLLPNEILVRMAPIKAEKKTFFPIGMSHLQRIRAFKVGANCDEDAEGEPNLFRKS